MLFNSYQFIFGFLPAVCIAYFVAVHFWGRRAGMGVLVAGSLFFYGWWNERYLWILLLVDRMQCRFRPRVDPGREAAAVLDPSPRIGIQSLAAGLFQICTFRGAKSQRAVGLDWQIEPMPLPLGISFFTFQKIAFLVDTYIGGVVSFDLLHYSLFVTFFPQLIAGPIVRHNEIIPQFRTCLVTPRPAISRSAGAFLQSDCSRRCV